MPPLRKTRQRYDVPGVARFLTFSCYRRLRLFDNDRIKSRFVTMLDAVSRRRQMEILAWVVMPEHVHLVLLPADGSASIESFLRSLKSPLSAEVLGVWRERDAAILPRLRDRGGDLHFWQAGGGYDRNVWGQELLEKIRYCHANPVTRGLCERSVDWAWSSARHYEGRNDASGPQIAFERVPRPTKALT